MLQRIEKPEHYLELGEFHCDDLIEFVNSLSSELWTQENALKENKFPCFHHTEHIIFQFIKGNKDPLDYYSNAIWDVCKPYLMPIMSSIAAQYPYKNPVFPKVMLAKLMSGSYIDPHYDGGGSNLFTHKIHLPLITDPDVKFMVEDEVFHMEPCVAYEVNNIKKHGVVNNSSIDRVHLIFEVFDKPE